MTFDIKYSRSKDLFFEFDMHTSVYEKRDDFGFPSVSLPWLSGDVP